MARSLPLRGNVKPVLKLSGLSATAPSVSAADFSDDARAISLTDGEGEAQTFSERSEGIAYKALEFEVQYSGDAGSAFQLLDINAGRKNVAVTWGPHGNLTAAAGMPVLTGIATLPVRPNLETEQGEENASFTVTLQLDSYTWTRV